MQTLIDQKLFKLFKAPEYKQTPTDEKEWAVELVGKYGSVYQYKRGMFVAYANSGQIYRKLLTLEGLTKHRECDKEGDCIFIANEERLLAVGKVLKLYKRSPRKSRGPKISRATPLPTHF